MLLSHLLEVALAFGEEFAVTVAGQYNKTERKIRIAKLDKIIVVDIESTCWRGPPPEGQMNEIIEVGIALLDVDDLTISENKGFLIKPRYSEVSDFCTELTSITPEMVANAPTFDYVCRRIISEYNTKARMWASYGEYDKKQFKKSCNKFQVEYPFNDKHLNVKTLASIYYGWDEVGMDKLLNKLKIPLEGMHHRGCDDANNIAKILREILKKGRL